MEPNTDHSLTFVVGRTNHVLQSEIRARLADANSELSPEGASVLQLLNSVGEPIRVNKLAKLAVRDGTTLKRQVDRLLKLGLVVQSKLESDGRVVLIACTEEGKRTVAELSPIFNSIIESAKNTVSEEDIETTVRVLNTMRANLLTE